MTKAGVRSIRTTALISRRASSTFVPQTSFFVAHLRFGLVVEVVLAMAFRGPAVASAVRRRSKTGG